MRTITGQGDPAVQHAFAQFNDANAECMSYAATLYRFQATNSGPGACSDSGWSSVISTTVSIDTCFSVNYVASDFWYRHIDLSLDFTSDGAVSAQSKGYKWTAVAEANPPSGLITAANGCFIIHWL